MEVLSSKYRLGDGQRIDNRERHQALDQELQLFGMLADDLRLSIKRQVKTETFKFMDMVQEYKSMLQGLKVTRYRLEKNDSGDIRGPLFTPLLVLPLYCAVL
jgi:hypothetical protein